LIDNRLAKRILDNGHGKEAAAYDPERGFIANPLEDFLNDRETGDQLLRREELLELDGAPLAQRLDPGGRVEKKQGKGLGLAARPVIGAVATHLGQFPIPDTRSLEFKDASDTGKTNHFLEGIVDRT